MTHEELQAHNGTVWSYTGFIGIHEYEYLGPSEKHEIYGTFRRVDTGEINAGIQVISCFPTKRAAIEDHLHGCLEHRLWAEKAVQDAQAELDALNAEECGSNEQ